MNQYLTGSTIKMLREKAGLTQAELALSLCVSDKTVSKWETGKGLPDITLLQPLSTVLGISIAELLAGQAITNTNVSGNMARSKFYVCPVCGNVLTSLGDACVSCHGIMLPALLAEEPDSRHSAQVERVEDEYFVTIDHPMTKDHYISFMAVLGSDKMQMVKLYPEGPAQARFNICGYRYLYYYCNKEGLFKTVLGL